MQFQAVAALRGLAVNPEVRLELLELWNLLFLPRGRQYWCRGSHSCTANISLNEENKVQIAGSGCLPALVQLAQSDDRERERYAVMTLANVAEMVEGRTQSECSKKGRKPLPASIIPLVDIRREVARLFALFASKRTLIRTYCKVVDYNRWFIS